MVEFEEIKGNFFEALPNYMNAHAVVNTVNCVGVMGKGVAKWFKEHYPSNYLAYKKACSRGAVKTGQMYITDIDGGELFNGRFNKDGPNWIINFPTKQHWRDPSKYLYIVTGLHDLTQVICELQIRSMTMPMLGCGNGGLDPLAVKALIKDALDSARCDITVYFPEGMLTL
jgi:O-acetyl-ADP-ribose deacetylase (regulator of RNase III)